MAKFTLYGDLEKVDELLELLIKNLQTGWPNYDEQYKNELSAVMRKGRRLLIENSKDNPVLQNAIFGEKSIEQSVEELSKKYQGIRKFLPHKKDIEYNERRCYLGSLITTPNWRTRGLFSLDNTLAATVLGAVVGYALPIALNASMPLNSPTSYNLPHNVMSVLASISCGVTMMAVGASITPRGKKESIEQARYLDNKIKELYH
jgi:hypothetical protein